MLDGLPDILEPDSASISEKQKKVKTKFGKTEYLPRRDPALRRLRAESLANHLRL
jgi:hypothetical protein